MNDNFNNKEMFGMIADRILADLQPMPKKNCPDSQPQAENINITQLLKVVFSYNGILREMEKSKQSACKNCKYKC